MSWIDKDRKRAFQTWADMKQRCYNKNSSQYKNYGARGIKVCDRWINSFENFLLDMGVKEDGMSIDRIDVNGNYEPSNCRWANKYEQQRNRRNNRVLTFNGISMTAREWSKELGIHEATISTRVLSGYPIEMVLSKDKFLFGTKGALATMAQGEKG